VLQEVIYILQVSVIEAGDIVECGVEMADGLVWEDGRIRGSSRHPDQIGTRSQIPDTVAPMGANQSRRIPKVQFRVLIIGRANAGKTTILQRVCDTTKSPTIYRNRGDKREEVRYSV